MIAKDQAQADLRVTNVYRREVSEWKMVHHHVDRNPPMQTILSKLETDRQT
jgi:ketosteroid isomerase-like protein